MLRSNFAEIVLKRWLPYCGVHEQCHCVSNSDQRMLRSNFTEIALKRWLLCCGAYEQRHCISKFEKRMPEAIQMSKTNAESMQS